MRATLSAVLRDALSNSNANFGLQLADVYLWLVNRAMSENKLPTELRHFAAALIDPQTIDGISMSGMVARFKTSERRLRQIQDIPDDLKAMNETTVAAHRRNVRDPNLG